MTQNWSLGKAEKADGKTVDTLAGAAPIGNVRNAVVGDPEKGLTKVEDYTTFLAEYTFLEGDIIVHFFQTKEIAKAEGKDRYWLRIFPPVMSDTAEEYFQATKPRIFAEYVPEMTSWYMRCHGFANRLDPAGYILDFFEKLDDALEAAVKNAQ